MKRMITFVLLIVVAVLIIKLSNTSSLKVIEPQSWLNDTEYEKNVTDLSFLKNRESTFYNYYDTEMIVEKNFIMHKTSHVLFYSLLTVLLFYTIKPSNIRFLTTITIIMVFAFLDEVHQFFIVGRSGRLSDAVLDSIAALLMLIIIQLREKTKKPKKTNVLS